MNNCFKHAAQRTTHNTQGAKHRAWCIAHGFARFLFSVLHYMLGQNRMRITKSSDYKILLRATFIEVIF